MSIVEIKEELIKKIQSTTDEHILLEASRLLEIQLDDNDAVIVLNQDVSNAIDEAKLQIERSEFLTHEEANKAMEEWLGK